MAQTFIGMSVSCDEITVTSLENLFIQLSSTITNSVDNSAFTLKFLGEMPTRAQKNWSHGLHFFLLQYLSGSGCVNIVKFETKLS